MGGELSIVIPAYNEEERIRGTLERIGEYLAGRDYEAEVIVVSDGSRDRTADIVREMKTAIPSLLLIELPRNRGKGYAVRAGIDQSGGRYVLFSDADLSTPIEEYERFHPLLARGVPVVIGSRGLPDSRIELHQSWYREGMGKMFNFLVRTLTVSGIRDTQCGFKAFRREVIARLISLQRVERFSFDVEILFLARKLGYEIAEVPVRWVNSPRSRVRIFRDSARMAWDLCRIRWGSMWGSYREEAAG